VIRDWSVARRADDNHVGRLPLQATPLKRCPGGARRTHRRTASRVSPISAGLFLSGLDRSGGGDCRHCHARCPGQQRTSACGFSVAETRLPRVDPSPAGACSRMGLASRNSRQRSGAVLDRVVRGVVTAVQVTCGAGATVRVRASERESSGLCRIPRETASGEGEFRSEEGRHFAGFRESLVEASRARLRSLRRCRVGCLDRVPGLRLHPWRGACRDDDRAPPGCAHRSPVLGMLGNRHGPKLVLFAGFMAEAVSMAASASGPRTKRSSLRSAGCSRDRGGGASSSRPRPCWAGIGSS
jgi:hypothetical protein